jgi:hypothetical protein
MDLGIPSIKNPDIIVGLDDEVIGYVVASVVFNENNELGRFIRRIDYAVCSINTCPVSEKLYFFEDKNRLRSGC